MDVLGSLLLFALLIPYLLYRLGQTPGRALTRQDAYAPPAWLSPTRPSLLLFDAVDWQRQQWQQAEDLLASQQRMNALSGLATLTLICGGGLLMLLMLALASQGVRRAGTGSADRTGGFLSRRV